MFCPVLQSAACRSSPFNAWVVLKGLETLDLRMRAAERPTRWQLAHLAGGASRQLSACIYPGLASHPQHALAMAQTSGVRRCGAVLRR
jgi:O-succinylhomoserine sulfhydrylase